MIVSETGSSSVFSPNCWASVAMVRTREVFETVQQKAGEILAVPGATTVRSDTLRQI
jgi:hypothetical protein